MGEFGRGLAVIFALWCVLILLGYNEKRADHTVGAKS